MKFPVIDNRASETDAVAYDHVVKAIGVPASRILFFDDLAENIEAARGLCLAPFM